jgi:hypothetical protein
MKRQLYLVKETKRGGKRSRMCSLSGSTKMTKTEAMQFAKAMRRRFGKEYTYRVVKAK